MIDVFTALPHVMFCMKDADGRYIAANEAFVRRAGRRRTDDVIGRCAHDLFPADLATSYDAQDRALLTTGVPVRNQIEVITDEMGGVGWYLTTKVLHEAPTTGRYIVVVSVEANLGRRGPAGEDLRAAIELVTSQTHEPLRADDLARAARMTTDQLERAMHRVLGVSPKQFMMRARLERAAMLLATTTLTVSEVAAKCGYYDQSQFTRQFRAATGTTPGRYRQPR